MKNVGVPETPLQVGAVDVVGDAAAPCVRSRRSSRKRSTSSPSSLGVRRQVAGVERVLVVEQQVVHLPERTLLGGRLGRLGGELRRCGWTSFSGRWRHT